jgi:type IV pilus assembly protein PilA
MKQFWITFVAALLGAALALAVHDRVVVQPRMAAAGPLGPQAMAPTPMPPADVSRLRSEAATISAEVSASVDRDVARMRMARQANIDEQEKRRLAMEPLARAAMFRTALTEYYQTEGRWPDSAADAGLPATDDAHGSAGRISIGPHGVISIDYDDRFAPGSQTLLVPDTGNSGGVTWSCRSKGDLDLARLVPACRG